jgi:ribulose bisphosphate carboxylase small subunit
MAVEATIETTTTTTVKISKKNKTDQRRYRTDGGYIPSKHFVDSPIVTGQNIFDGPTDGHHKSPIVTDQ